MLSELLHDRTFSQVKGLQGFEKGQSSLQPKHSAPAQQSLLPATRLFQGKQLIFPMSKTSAQTMSY